MAASDCMSVMKYRVSQADRAMRTHMTFYNNRASRSKECIRGTVWWFSRVLFNSTVGGVGRRKCLTLCTVGRADMLELLGLATGVTMDKGEERARVFVRIGW